MRLAAIVIIMYTSLSGCHTGGGGYPPSGSNPPPLLVVWLSVHSRQFFCQRMPYFPSTSKSCMTPWLRTCYCCLLYQVSNCMYSLLFFRLKARVKQANGRSIIQPLPNKKWHCPICLKHVPESQLYIDK